MSLDYSIEYATGTATEPTGAWVEGSLTDVTGFYWERVKSNGVTTTPTLVESKLLGDSRNLLKGTAFANGTKGDLGSNMVFSVSETESFISDTTTLTASNISSYNASIFLNRASPYTFSFYGKGWEEYGDLYITVNSGVLPTLTKIQLIDGWTKYIIRHTGTGNLVRIIPNNNTINPYEVYINAPKLEAGEMATDWQPAPEDRHNITSIIEVNKRYSNVSYVGYEYSTTPTVVTRNSVNEDWWSNLGVIQSKVVLEFTDETSIELYSTDYIKSWKLTQDLSSDNSKPVFDFISDKLDLVLFSLDNDFNPFAENSEYYGKFTIGNKVYLSVKVDYLDEEADTLNWRMVGQYEIADIDVSPNGLECNILAYGFGFKGIENSKQQPLAQITDNATSFFTEVFPDYNINISDEITVLPKLLFPLENKLETINEFLAATFSYASCDGGGFIEIGTFDTTGTHKAVLDNSNIISLTPEQSLIRQYNSSAIKWNELGLQPNTEVINLTATFTEAGTKEYENIALSGYITKLEILSCNTSDGADITDALISDVYANAVTIKITATGACSVNVRLKAEILTFNEITEGDLENGENICEIDNKFIQTKEHAVSIKNKLDKFITTKNQYCGAEIAFNPLINLASLVKCTHEDYDIDILGFIVEQTLEISDSTPAGRQTLRLLNKEAVT